MKKKNIYRLIATALYLGALFVISTTFSACSPGGDGLLQITPQQYFYSAKERLETIDERDYEIRDLDEIIRVLENAEKDATSTDIMDRSRLYLIVANALKARKLYQNNLLEGKYIAGRAPPLYILDLQDVKEALRDSKKWLMICEREFNSSALIPDLKFAKGLHYQQKMLTQRGSDRRESLQKAINAFRRCLGMAPDYESDFRLFRQNQTAREVRLKLIETLALGGYASEAYGILSEFNFAPFTSVAGAIGYQDYAWHHKQGLTLAMMGLFEDAAEILEPFKIITPRQYTLVDEALWLLEGIYDYRADKTGDPIWQMEARIVASLLNRLTGPYSAKQYSTAAHLFPRFFPGDKVFAQATRYFYSGRFKEALEKLETVQGRSVMSRENRTSSQLMRIESMLYSDKAVTDDILEDLISIALSNNLTPLQKERAAYLLARYVMDQDHDFATDRVNHEGQTFIRSITQRPWAVDIKYRRGEIKRPTRPLRKRTEEDYETATREPGELIAEVYANRPRDWIVSSTLYIFTLPELSLVGTGRIVGREQEGEGWIFRDERLDTMNRRNRYLTVFEFDNSDNETFLQGALFSPRP